MFTFLHTADIHLDSPLRGLERYPGAPAERLRQATRKAFDRLIELALTEPVDFVLIAGDLYDGDWRDYNTGLYFASRMSRLGEAGIPAFWATGNHDAASSITKTLRLPDNVTVFPTDSPCSVTLDRIGAAIHGQGFETPAVRKNLAANYPAALPGYVNIGLLHTCATGREGHEPYGPCSMDDLNAKGYDYWALGHIHKREVLQETPPVIFPGNLQGRHIRETGAKGCMAVTVEDNGAIRPVFTPLDVLRWEKVEVSVAGLPDGYAVVDRIAERIADSVDRQEDRFLAARIVVTGLHSRLRSMTSDPERWSNEIRSAVLDAAGEKVWIEKVKFSAAVSEKDPETVPAEGPMGELLDQLERLRAEPRQLPALGSEIRDLFKKLPPELRAAPDAPEPESVEWLQDMLDQVRILLLDRLRSAGNGS